MSRTLVLGRVTPPKPPGPGSLPSRRWNDPVVLAVLLAALLGLGWWIVDRGAEAPTGTSPEVGFARDMSDHHAQAVELAELIRTRSGDPRIRLLATDIALTQQAQIGRMSGWLDAWGQPPTGAEPPMSWMGHRAGDAMPGMASREEVAALAASSGANADELFLRLMIRHHRGGLLMAVRALQLADEPEVRSLALAVRNGQSAEIDAMEDLLAALGAEPETEAITRDAIESSPDEGRSFSEPVRRFAPAGVTLLPLAWLVLDDRSRRRAWVQGHGGPPTR